MAISICTDRVTFGSFDACSTPGGMSIGGTIFAECGFCDTTIPGAIGRSAGYAVGGYKHPGNSDRIDKYSFTSNGNSTEVGDISQGGYNMSGAASETNGYTMSGAPPTGGDQNIYRYPFASDTNSTDVGQIHTARSDTAGHSSPVAGYTSGGKSPAVQCSIDKFPFAADNTCFDVGDLEAKRFAMGGHSSNENGYASGGCAPTPCSCLSKFPFASDTNASSIGGTGGNNRGCHGGHSSPTAAFLSGGRQPGAEIDEIRCFPFASDNPATDVGTLSKCFFDHSATSSTECGYASGMYVPFGISNPDFFQGNHITKFDFSASVTGADVGNLTQARRSSAGFQN